MAEKRKIKPHKGGRPHKLDSRLSVRAFNHLQALVTAGKGVLSAADVVNMAILNCSIEEIQEQKLIQEMLDAHDE